jgi:hypothetical protein
VSLCTDNNNNVWLYSAVHSGSYFGTSQFTSSHGGGYALTTLSKINSSGTFILIKELSTLSVNYKEAGIGKPHLVTCDSANNIYVMVNLQTNYPPVPPFLNGNISIPSTRYIVIYILKYKNNGNLVWYKRIGGSSISADDYGTQISFVNGKLLYTGHCVRQIQTPLISCSHPSLFYDTKGDWFGL